MFLVLPLVGNRVGGGGSSLPCGCSAAASYLLRSPISSLRPRDGEHSEMTRLASRPWWHMLVDGKLGGALQIVGVVGVGRNSCRLVRLRRGYACGRHRSFLRGVGCTPSHYPWRTGGNSRISLSSSIVIVALLLVSVAWYSMCRSAKSVVEFSRGRSDGGSSSFSRSFIVGISFSCFIFWAFMCCLPQRWSHICMVGCYINIVGRKPISSVLFKLAI